MLYSGQKVSPPLLTKQTKENHIKNSSQAASVNFTQIGNSRYAMEGPLTTNTSTPTCPRNKRSLTNSSARTQVYHRKTNSRKQQSNLCPEKKIHKFCHDTADQREEKASKFGHQEHRGQLVNTSVVGRSLSLRRKEMKVCVSDPHTHKLPLSMSITSMGQLFKQGLTTR